MSQRVDFYWGEQFDSDNAPAWGRRRDSVLKADAVVGSIDGLMAMFGSKDSYTTLFWHCKDLIKRGSKRRVLCPAAWLPSFNVFGDEDKASKKFKKGKITAKDVPYLDRLFSLARDTNPPTWWIVKPQKGTFLSRGMHISQLRKTDMNTPTTFVNWIAKNVMEPSCAVKYESSKCDRRMVSFQIYVHKPALFHGRKFDMRFWLVVASLDPLRLYMLRHAYPKVSSREFTTGNDDQCVHIKMLLDPFCNVTMRQFRRNFPSGYPRSTASPVFFDGLEFPGIKKPGSWVVKEQFWSRHVWPAVEASLVKVLMLARPNMTKLNKRHKKSRKTFALLSPDLTLDEKGRVYIEEINTNGLVMGTHGTNGGASNLFFDNGYVRDLLQIVGADAYPRAPQYQAKLDAAISTFCADNHDDCGPDEREAFARAVHEEAHAGQHFYRVYPPISCFEREEFSHCRLHHGNQTVWPNQATFSDDDLAAMPESPIDRIVRRFLQTTDTELIHGVPQVPGHARWPPRDFHGASALR